MNISDEQLQVWAKPPSATKYIATRDRIEKALRDKFGSQIDVYLQGSYKNSTNVRAESDVDIIVEYLPAYYPGFFKVSDEDKDLYHRNHDSHDYNHAQFKNDVTQVLIDEFSESEVKRGQKSIKVVKNENRVNADVIACFTHKRFISAVEYDHDAVGIHFFTDSGQEVINFPRQHHRNGEYKNQSTREKFKDMVRIYKNIRYQLIDEGLMSADDIASHLIECLVWNVPSSYFNGSYSEILKSVTAYLWIDLEKEKDPNSRYVYIHDLQWLFQNGSYSSDKAEEFMGKVWGYAKF